MKTGKYKVLMLVAYLFTALNCDVKASNEIILVKAKQPHKATISSSNQAINELNEVVKDMKYQLLCAQNEIMKLQEVNLNLTKSLSEAEVKSQMLEKQNILLVQDIATKDKQLEEITKQANFKLNTSNNEITDLKNQLSVYHGKSENMSQQIITLNSELNKIKQEYSTANSKVDNIANDKDTQINLLKNKATISENLIQDLSEKIITLNNDLTNTKETYTLALNRQKELENLVTLANKRASNIPAVPTSELIRQMRPTININNDEIIELKNQLYIYRKKAEDMAGQIISLNNELNKAKLQNSSDNLKVENIVNDKGSQISLLQNQLAFSEKQIQDSSYKINTLTSDLEKTKEVYSLALGRQKELENLIALSNKRADDLINEKNVQLNELKKQLAVTKQPNITAAVQTTAINNNYQKPVADFSTDNVANTKSAEDYFNIAQAYKFAKDYKEAINNYKSAIAINSSFSNAYKELGLVYAQIGDYKNASSYLKKCLYYSTNSREQDIIRNFLSNIAR